MLLVWKVNLDIKREKIIVLNNLGVERVPRFGENYAVATPYSPRKKKSCVVHVIKI